jgi:hypothetical protein
VPGCFEGQVRDADIQTPTEVDGSVVRRLFRGGRPQVQGVAHAATLEAAIDMIVDVG